MDFEGCGINDRLKSARASHGLGSKAKKFSFEPEKGGNSTERIPGMLSKTNKAGTIQKELKDRKNVANNQKASMFSKKGYKK